jgi:hypothetical protein
MGYKAEIWQICRGTTQTKRKNPKAGKFCSRDSEMGGWNVKSLTSVSEGIQVIRVK